MECQRSHFSAVSQKLSRHVANRAPLIAGRFKTLKSLGEGAFVVYLAPDEQENSFVPARRPVRSVRFDEGVRSLEGALGGDRSAELEVS